MESNKQNLSPLLKATEVWSKVSVKLESILGEVHYGQWFEDVIPIDLNEHTVYLQTKSRFDSLWISNNYQNLVDGLFDMDGKKITAVFLSHEEMIEKEKLDFGLEA